MDFQIGDWVKGNTNQGELVHGYIDAVHASRNTVDVHVVASDRESAVGRLIEIRDQSVKKLAQPSLDHTEQLKSLIDLALTTRDEAWFMELTSKLNALHDRHVIHDPEDRGLPNASRSTNRLGYETM